MPTIDLTRGPVDRSGFHFDVIGTVVGGQFDGLSHTIRVTKGDYHRVSEEHILQMIETYIYLAMQDADNAGRSEETEFDNKRVVLGP